MSGGILNLSILPIDEQQIPFSNPIVGTGNTVLIKTQIQGTTVLIGTGSTENGELGVINPNLANESALRVNNSVGFSPYEANISIIAGGEDFFGFVYVNDAVVIEDEVYTWGKNDKYQLGRGDKDASGNNIVSRQAGPGRVDISNISFAGSNRVRTYQCGWTHAHIVTRSNRVFSWGNNYYGQLGISGGISGSSIDPSNTGVPPQEIDLSLNGETPYSVYGGKDFSAVLTLSGNVYTYGINDHYQLGISDNSVDFCENPIKIDISNVVHMAPGKSFVSVVRSDGTVWGWGDDTYGQISSSAYDGSERYITTPTQITDINDAVYVTAGNNHVCILRQNGTLRLVGDNQFNQTDSPSENKNIVFGTAIANNTFYIEVDGDLFGYGAGVDNDSGLLGNTTTTTEGENPIKSLNPINNSTIRPDVLITTTYGSILSLQYNLIPEVEVREIVKFDEDQTLPSSEYMEQKKAICFVKNLERKTNSVASGVDECCSADPNSKPVIRFRSLKEQLQYEKGLFILDKKCLIRSE